MNHTYKEKFIEVNTRDTGDRWRNIMRIALYESAPIVATLSVVGEPTRYFYDKARSRGYTSEEIARLDGMHVVERGEELIRTIKEYYKAIGVEVSITPSWNE